MRMIIAILAFALSSVATDAGAQASFSQRAWLRGTKVVVFNATYDQRPIRIILDEKNVDRVLGPGEHWSASFGGGLPIVYTSNQRISLVITAKGCDSQPTRLTVAPPDWARDESFLGAENILAATPGANAGASRLTLSDDYLESRPSEPELKKRVEEIKKFLDHQLGGKRMKRELDDWFKAAKNVGLAFNGLDCNGPDIEGVRVDFNVDSWNESHRAIAIYIRGDRARGYVMEPPRWIAY